MKTYRSCAFCKDPTGAVYAQQALVICHGCAVRQQGNGWNVSKTVNVKFVASYG